jgi:hypothetical protein
VAAILLCDQILQQSDQILALACKMQASATNWNSQQYKQLQTFVEFLEHNRPKFRAARFFSIDRSLLFKILHAAITFLLVMIQID